jgi:hypothetical protein
MCASVYVKNAIGQLISERMRIILAFFKLGDEISLF